MTFNRSSLIRLCAAVFTFAAGLWFGMRGGNPSGGETVNTSATAVAVPGREKTVAAQDALISQNPAEREQERALLDLLAPDPSRPFHGEELARLCLADNARDLPGGNDAFAYAARWAKHDPAGMNAWFMKRGSLTLPTAENNSNYGFSSTIFDNWTRKDPEEALRHALAWEREGPKRDAVQAVISVLAKQDFERAAAVLRENAALLAGGGGLRAYGSADHDLNLRLLQNLPEGAARARMLGGYVLNLMNQKGEQVERIWNAGTTETKRELIRGGFFYDPETHRNFSSVVNPEAKGVNLENFEAMQREVAESGDSPEVAIRFINIHAKEWARRDFPEAAQWAMTYLKGAQGMDTTAWLFGSAARENYESVEAVWRDLPEGNLKVEALKRMLSQSPSGFKPRAQALLDELPPAEAENLRKQLR